MNIFILGNSSSGSTILEDILHSSFKDLISLGESKVLDELNSSTDLKRRELCEKLPFDINPSDCPNDLKWSIWLMVKLTENGLTFIESSKSSQRLSEFIHISKARPLVIHILKEPRFFVDKLIVRKSGRFGPTRLISLLKLNYIWSINSYRQSFVSRRKLYNQLWYKDFCEDPLSHIQKISNLTGLAISVKSMNNAIKNGPIPSSFTVAGNPRRYSPSPIAYDGCIKNLTKFEVFLCDLLCFLPFIYLKSIAFCSK